MRIEYRFELNEVEIPRFSIEAVEGIGKLFTLATLVLNVLAVKQRVEIVFHGLNPEDPDRKFEAFKEILASCLESREIKYEIGSEGRISRSSSYFRWVVVRHT